MGSMKVHQVTRGFWEHEPSLSVGSVCKRLGPLSLKQSSNSDSSSSSNVTTLDLKSFIKSDCGPRKQQFIAPQVEVHSGGTRWNPTQEQIGILEMLYKDGMRTPNANQIEHITAQLGKYGKIEGKNVFYWFQNHKARERSKRKRNSLGLTHSKRALAPSTSSTVSSSLLQGEEDSHCYYKRKPRSCYKEDHWLYKDEGDFKTLELFPLHPEGI